MRPSSTAAGIFSPRPAASFSLYLPSSADRRFRPIGRSDLQALVVVASPVGLERYGLMPSMRTPSSTASGSRSARSDGTFWLRNPVLARWVGRRWTRSAASSSPPPTPCCTWCAMAGCTSGPARRSSTSPMPTAGPRRWRRPGCYGVCACKASPPGCHISRSWRPPERELGGGARASWRPDDGRPGPAPGARARHAGRPGDDRSGDGLDRPRPDRVVLWPAAGARRARPRAGGGERRPGRAPR